MKISARMRLSAGALGVVLAGLSGVALGALPMSPVNDRPNPYQTMDGWLKMPQGRAWGSTAGIEIAPDGKSVWVIDSFGGGKFAFPHGLFVDADENIWVTDAVLGDGRGAGAAGLGQTVQKFDKDGKLLMTLGTPGVPGNDEK